jgi:acyl dehydratase
MTQTQDWQRDWQPMIEAIGTDFDTNGPVEGADSIELGSIRRYLEPLEFSCPLHWDPRVAREHGYADVLAPGTSLLSFTIPPIWRPGDPPVFTDASRDAQPTRSGVAARRTGLEPEFTGFFATDFALDWLGSATVGDRLHRRGNKLVSCVPKQTSVGRGAFISWESQLGNQRGELVALLRSSTYAYTPGPPGDETRPAGQARTGAAAAPWFEPAAPVDWNRQRTWEEVAEGDQLPAIAFPVSVYRLVVEAGANRDFNSIHHNSEYARATGAPEMYANTIFLQGMWERVVREYIGLRGQFRSLSGFRMSRFNVAGDTVVVRGTVTRKWREADEGLLAIRLWSENSQGLSVGPGSVTVSLPSDLHDIGT